MSVEAVVSNPSDDFMPLRSVRLSASLGTMDIDAPSSSLTTRIMEGSHTKALGYGLQRARLGRLVAHLAHLRRDVRIERRRIQRNRAGVLQHRSNLYAIRCSKPLAQCSICIKLLDTEDSVHIGRGSPCGNALFIDSTFTDNLILSISFTTISQSQSKRAACGRHIERRRRVPVNPDELARKLTGILRSRFGQGNKELDKVLEGTFFDRSSRNYAYRPLRHSIQVYFPVSIWTTS